MEIEWLWGNAGEGRGKGVSKVLTFGAWDSVIDTHGEDWKGTVWGAVSCTAENLNWGKGGTSKWKSQSFP